MARQRHLNSAPIVEAIIDLRVGLPSAFNPQEFLSLSNILADRYPTNEPRKMFAGAFGLEEGKPFIQPPEDKGIQGYVYKSKDEKNVVQFRIDGFTFSRLYPYTEWEDVLLEAKGLWKLYSSISVPELITRVALRYINRLDIPLPIDDLQEYFTAPPKIPDSLPQEMRHFFIKIVIQESDISANIVQALQGSSKPEHVGIIFDIDVFKRQESGFDEDTIWQTFEQLRDLKNRIFFESITEKTARMYE